MSHSPLGPQVLSQLQIRGTKGDWRSEFQAWICNPTFLAFLLSNGAPPLTSKAPQNTVLEPWVVGGSARQASFGLHDSLGCAESFSGCQMCKDPCTLVCLGVPCWKLLWTSLSFRKESQRDARPTWKIWEEKWGSPSSFLNTSPWASTNLTLDWPAWIWGGKSGPWNQLKAPFWGHQAGCSRSSCDSQADLSLPGSSEGTGTDGREERLPSLLHSPLPVKKEIELIEIKRRMGIVRAWRVREVGGGW